MVCAPYPKALFMVDKEKNVFIYENDIFFDDWGA